MHICSYSRRPGEVLIFKASDLVDALTLVIAECVLLPQIRGFCWKMTGGLTPVYRRQGCNRRATWVSVYNAAK